VDAADIKQESPCSSEQRLLDKIWHRPTLPHFTAVPSALAGLTSLFGMGRGGHRRYRHLNIFIVSGEWIVVSGFTHYSLLTIHQQHLNIIERSILIEKTTILVFVVSSELSVVSIATHHSLLTTHLFTCYEKASGD
jgi:hypothetical protein